MSITINIPFPDKKGFVESKLNVDDITNHFLDWLIGCYDGGEEICGLLPYYMTNIKEVFSDKENTNLDMTQDYFKKALDELKNTRIDEAVQQRINNKKLNLDLDLENPNLENWTFQDVDSYKEEFVGVKDDAAQIFNEHRFDKSLWSNIEYTNSDSKYEDGIFSYTAQAKSSTKNFLTKQIENSKSYSRVKWVRSQEKPVILTMKKLSKDFLKDLGEATLDTNTLDDVFKGVSWFEKMDDSFWKSKAGFRSNSDYLLNPNILLEYDIKIPITKNSIGKPTIVAKPIQEVSLQGEQRKGVKDDLWRHLKGKMKVLERYVTEATT